VAVVTTGTTSRARTAAVGPQPSGGRELSVAFVATCPPRQCGIATFSRDLERALKAADPRVRIAWAAINEPMSLHRYGPEVRWRIRQGDPESYREAAEQLNRSRVDVVSLQHEFGLYGVWGDTFDDHLAPFLDALEKPLATTLHSVLPEPTPSVRAALQRLARRSGQVVVMAERARRLLIEVYGITPNKVYVIPHGVPPVEPHGRTRMKKQLGLAKRTILTTFGLVDPRKGLEYMVEAMREVRQQCPDALYLIVGKTHPELVRRDGEAYRKGLWQLVQDRGLGQHVAFVDEYLTQAQIVDYLLASDVYITPYLDPQQITSGTLAYALGAGKAIISTPYLHAAEVLTHERGLLVDFRSASQLAEASLRVLGDPGLKQRLELNAYLYGRETAWPRVGERMLSVLRRVASDQPVTPDGSGPIMPTTEDGGPLAMPRADKAGDVRSDPRAEVAQQ
jgi:glycosyltransferase involved in cell wall biosynthesis